MQILSTAQIHAWDEYTINNEPIASIDLMERAATACYNWLLNHGFHQRDFTVFCGKGNNGGDGLAIARMLSNSGLNVTVYILEFGHLGTSDFQQNLARLHETNATIQFVSSEAGIPAIAADHVVIDAILGSGLNRQLDGLTAALVGHINLAGNTVIAIDIPTGLFADRSSESSFIVKARHTLTFQAYKLSFLFAESAPFIGQLHLLDIGLHPGYLEKNSSTNILLDYEYVKSLFRQRKKFSHKGDYGHAALITGSKGLMGASVLAARACIRSGVGKLTCHIPEVGYEILQVSVPEAMSYVEDGGDYLQKLSSLEKYDAVAIGPGLGLQSSHDKLLAGVITGHRKPMVIDADALNVLSRKKELIKKLPEGCILTPHTREFERLFGDLRTDDARMQKAVDVAAEMKGVVVLKGPHTLIATQDGRCYFNNTGNPGMATGGSGDVLTGVILGLLSQGYSSEHAAVLGVFVHGLAGDIASVRLSMTSLIASDIIDYLGEAFKRFEIR